MQAKDEAGPCLEAETLAAWMDGGLSAAERATVEAHASSCDRCQMMLAAFVRAEPPPSRPVRPWSARVFRWMVPLTAGAAAVLALLFAVEPRVLRSPAPVPPPQVAPQPTPAPASAPRTAQPQVDAMARRDEQRRAASTPAPAAAAPALDKTVAGAPPPEAANEPKTLAAPSPAPLAQAASNAVAADRVSERIADIVSPSSVTRWRIVSPDRVERSLDGGATWTRTALPAGAQVAAGTSPAAGICWLAGRNGLVLRTIDGSTWTPIAFPEPLALVSVRATSADAAVVTADSGASFATTDGGRTWVRQ